ncbi:MAG: MBL fold metallo-hydrolase [Burkholderiales bacterium]|nr:MBL fold metallo-hydrolase [Burkholderiales bacterium]
MPAGATELPYHPSALAVTDNVYAIIGPLGQRSEANAGLNANYGFVVAADGVILIDSGASAHSAALLERTVHAVTPKPIRWVLNTGAQDHRWLGNDYFARKGAEVHALAATVHTQRAVAEQQLNNLRGFVGTQLRDTVPRHAIALHPGPDVEVRIGGVRLRWVDISAHYPGDSMILLPEQSVAFTGDLVYVDRLLGVLPQSDVRKAHAAFARLRQFAPKYTVPGHGRVTDLARAQRESGDYYAFLIDNVGAAARNLDALTETLDRFANPSQFRALRNFPELHRANMNRVFVDFESRP